MDAPTPNDLIVQITHPTAGAVLTVRGPSGLRFTSTAPGGFASLEVTIPIRSAWQPPMPVQLYSRVTVYDARTAVVVWEGRVTDPGATRDAEDGDTLQVIATGNRAYVDDIRRPVLVVDRDQQWYQHGGSRVGTRAMVDNGSGLTFTAHGSDPAASTPTSYLQWMLADGQKVPGAEGDQWAYLWPSQVDSTIRPAIAKLCFSQRQNATDSGFEMQLLQFRSGSGWTVVRNDSWSTTEQDLVVTAGDLITAGYAFRWNRTGAAVELTADRIAGIANMVVCGVLYSRSGAANGNPPLVPTPLNVVDHLLGSVLLSVVTPNLMSTSTSGEITQAVWRGEESVADILDWVVSEDDGRRYWAVWETGMGGKPLFDFMEWGTTPRYRLLDDLTLNLDGGADQLANRALVTYQGPTGPAITQVSVAVPALDNVGMTAATTLDVTGEGPMTTTRAQARGTARLREMNRWVTTGSVTVNRPVLDLVDGRMVAPWEIRPGCLVEFPTSVEGYYRLTSVSWDGNAATLELDGGSRSLIRTVRAAARQRKRAAWNGRGPFGRR